MEPTNGHWQSRPLGVLLMVEIQGRLPEGPGQIKKTWMKQLKEAVKYFTGLLSLTSHGLQQHHGAGVEDESDEEDVPFDFVRVLAEFFCRVDFQSIPIQLAGNGMLQDIANGRGEYTIFVENASPIVNDSPAIDEAHVRGLDLEVQELVRARRVTRIGAYRVVEFI